MRIGILGSHCTGKTTLAQQLSEELKTPLIPEQARLAWERGFELDHKATLKTQLMIWMMQLEAENNHESFVADRTLLDSVVYGQLNKSIDELDFMMMAKLASLTMPMMNRYDILFYTPILWPVVSDDFRNTEEDYREAIDNTFKAYMRKLPVIELPAENRLEIALDHIDGIQRSR